MQDEKGSHTTTSMNPKDILSSINKKGALGRSRVVLNDVIGEVVKALNRAKAPNLGAIK